MEYRTLKYFLTVAQEENITRAADILHISQPGLSRQMALLEEELGTQLFERGRRRTTLTEEGMLLRRRAQEIIELTEKTAHEFKAGGKIPAGTVTIGSGEGDITRFLAELIRKFGATYPAVKFDLYSGDADNIKERLDHGTLDFGIIIGNSDISKYKSIVLPVKERWGVIVPADSPLSRKTYVTPKDLAGQKVFVSRRGVAQGVTDWFGKYYDKLEISAAYNLLYNAAVLVEKGMGAALCIEGAVSLYDTQKIVFVPFYPELTVKNTLIWKEQTMSVTAAAFLAFMQESLSSDIPPYPTKSL